MGAEPTPADPSQWAERARGPTPSDRRRLTEIAYAILPEAPDLAGSFSLPVERRGYKRNAMVWTTLLDELAAQLDTGQFYSLDLPTIDEPLNRVAER